jgi:hypothetical protein
MMKKFFCAACAVMAMSVFADAPAPAAEFKFNEGDLQAIKCTNPAVVIKPGYPANLGWGAGRLDGKAVEFKNNFPNNKRGGMGYFGIPAWGSKLNKPFTITVWAKLDAGCKNNGPQYMDIEQDWPFICAGFQQAYGIDLYSDKSMHIIRWQALLQGLPKDTKLMDIIGIRAMDVPEPNKHNAKQIAEINRLKAQYALKNTAVNFETGLGGLFDLLEARAKGV